MNRYQLLRDHFLTLRELLVSINHTDCRILEEERRAELVTELVSWYVTKCGPLDTADVLRKGWKGFEDMDDLELITDWFETLIADQVINSNQQLDAVKCAKVIESAIELKLKLAKSIL